MPRPVVLKNEALQSKRWLTVSRFLVSRLRCLVPIAFSTIDPALWILPSRARAASVFVESGVVTASMLVRGVGSLLCPSIFARLIVLEVSSALQESQRLEEEEGRLMKEIHDLQSRLMRTREQKVHVQKKQKTLFDRGMVEFQKDLGESSGEVEGSSASVGASVDVGDPDWLRELEALSPGSLEQLAASVGQGSGDASFQSLS